MRRVRPYQGPANTPSDEPGVLDTSSECLFESPYRLRRRRFLKAGPARSCAEWGPSSAPAEDDPPDFGVPGRQQMFVPRLPARGGGYDPERLSRHTETVEILLNSLLRKGTISQGTSPDDFHVVAGGFAADRDPGPDDDATKGAKRGISWFNCLTGKLFYCKDPTAGAAEWTPVN